jgi:uncharacterized LabA/DUF88 family protein
VSDLIVYVDGYNLFHGLRSQYHDDRYQWLDLVSLSRLLRKDDNLVRVNYYTAPLKGTPTAIGRQQTYFGALQAAGGAKIKIHQARYQTKTVNCVKCGARWHSYEEKETDVHMAVDIVADIATESADSALIISGDSDLCPAVLRAQQFNPAARITMAFPPKRVSSKLKDLLPTSFVIGDRRIRQAQLPETIIDSNGTLYERPDGWKKPASIPAARIPADAPGSPHRC